MTRRYISQTIRNFRYTHAIPKKLEKLFDRLGIDVVGEDEVVTLWDLINEDNAGCISCVEADGETVFDIPENLKSEGMYEAE